MNEFRTQYRLLLRFGKFLLPYRKSWFLILILGGMGMCLPLANPYLGKLIIDNAIAHKDVFLFVVLAVIGAAIFIITGVIEGMKNYVVGYLKANLSCDLNQILIAHLQHLSLSQFQDRSTAERQYRTGSDAERVSDFLLKAPERAVAIFPKLLFLLIIVFYLHWKMALLACVFAPGFALPAYYFTARKRERLQRLIELSQEISKSLHEMLSHIQLIKAFGRESHWAAAHREKLLATIGEKIAYLRLEISTDLALNVLNRCITGVVALYGGYQVIKGGMTLGSYVAIMAYLGQLIGMYGQLVHFFQQVVLGLLSCQALSAILEERPQIVESENAQAPVFVRGQISLRRIAFGFSPDKLLFKDLSLNIPGGSHVAIVGPSGCGKSTLLNLILRLYDPTGGDILMDGHNIKDLTFISMKSQIGIALQSPFLFNQTLRDNIAFAVPDASEGEVIEVATICEIHEFIAQLPDQYQTRVGEEACKLSQGQKQKIAIARALIKWPKILILDEATASMDSASEEKILSNIKNRCQKMTLISVSHRLSTVMKAEMVYYLVGTGEMKTGTPANLLADRDFASLFASQIQPQFQI